MGDWVDDAIAESEHAHDMFMRDAADLKRGFQELLDKKPVATAELEPQPDLAAALEEAEAEVERLVQEYDRVNPRGGKKTATFRQAEKRLREGRNRVRDIQGLQRDNVYAAATTELVSRRQAKWAEEASKEVDKKIAEFRKKAERERGNTETALAAWDQAAMAERRRAETVQAVVSEKLAAHAASLEQQKAYQAARDQGFPSSAADAISRGTKPPMDTVKEKSSYSKAELEQVMRENPERGWQILNAGQVRFENLP